VFERIQCLEQSLKESHSPTEFSFPIPGLKDQNSINHADVYNQIFQNLKGKFSGNVERNIKLVDTNVFIEIHLNLIGRKHWKIFNVLQHTDCTLCTYLLT